MPDPVTGLIVAASTVYSTETQKDAVEEAGEAQTVAAESGIDVQREQISEMGRQFDAVQELLKPYADAGAGALEGQEALIGLQGPTAQEQAIQGIKGSPQFQMLQETGEESILQNAAATGGLRGGNTQAALAQYSPQILSQLIESQFGKLGQVVGTGQSSAAGVGSSVAQQSALGMQGAANIANLYGQQGAARAGTALGKGQANTGMFNKFSNLALMKSMGAF
ncbi:MAG: hypothetical protein GY774_36205 [Planctomycetes bacterium]|nr:hypothetical protein [Planctomycetota bacterium]